MHYRQEYQQGPLHLGKLDVDFRLYGWHEKEIEAYKRYREEEEIEMLELVDSSVKAALEALKDDLEEFLAEAGEPFPDQKAQAKTRGGKERRSNILDPFLSVGKGLGEMVGSVAPSTGKNKKAGEKPFKYNKVLANKAAHAGHNGMWQVYKNFKKGHKMLSW